MPTEPDVVRLLVRARDAVTHMLAEEAIERPELDWDSLLAWLRAEMAWLPFEQVRAIYLNAANRILRNEVLGSGCVMHAPVIPREIMRRALEVGATSLVLVHNHPSGNPAPSEADIVATRAVVRAARAVDLHVIDHLIVSVGKHYSFRRQGLM